jgi:regulator of protease activity HflC (stomatin/prohibitin superfamily)
MRTITQNLSNTKPFIFFALFILVACVVLTIVQDGYFIVEPNEMAAVRRLGQVISPAPLKPGLYFKIPLIDKADKLAVSLDSFVTENLVVYTVDNQPVTISASMSYRIPEKAVFKLLYQVGRTGSVDIAENVRPVLNDRIMRVFAKTNTTRISEDRVTIAEQIKASSQQVLDELFSIEVVDLQISAIRYSEAFEASIENAVKAKNEATAAENTVKKIQYEGEQKVVTAKAAAEQRVIEAKADAEATLARAEADKQAKILAAQGEAQAIELEGAAKAKSLKVQADAIKNNPEIIELTKAQRWSGELPKTILGNTVPFLNINELTAEPK